jgi:hypothetical protein
MKRLCSLVLLLCLAASNLYAQTPNLVVSAGSTGQATSLTVTSDSTNPWKCFTVTGGSNQYNVIWAESTGTSGGIYFGSIATSSSGSAGPVTPAPSDLPLGALATAVSSSLTAVDAATATTVANAYESLAKGIDSGTIVSPLQLQLATSAQLLSLTSDQLTACNGFIRAVNSWVDAQQSAGRLAAAHMDRYAKTYHAIAQAVKPGTVTPPPASSAKVPMAAAEPWKVAPPQPAGNSPCASGHCPMPTMDVWYRRWR